MKYIFSVPVTGTKEVSVEANSMEEACEKLAKGEESLVSDESEPDIHNMPIDCPHSMEDYLVKTKKDS